MMTTSCIKYTVLVLTVLSCMTKSRSQVFVFKEIINGVVYLKCRVCSLDHDFTLYPPSYNPDAEENIFFAVCNKPIHVNVGVHECENPLHTINLDTKTATFRLGLFGSFDNGNWTCIHGNLPGYITLEAPEKNPESRSQVIVFKEIINEDVFLNCHVSSLDHDFTLYPPSYNPDGEDNIYFAVCHKPIHVHVGVHQCENPLHTINLDTKTVTFRLGHIGSFHNGNWTCTHGNVPGYITLEAPEKNPAGHNDMTWIAPTIFALFFGTSTFVLMLLRCLGQDSDIDERKENTDPERRPLLESADNAFTTETTGAVLDEMLPKEEPVIKYRPTTCVICENLTSYAFCQTCKEYLCETCSNDHRKKEPQHVIFQLVNLYCKEKWVICNQCNSHKCSNSVRLCTLYNKVLCAKCIRTSFHHNKDQYPIKQVMTLSEKTFRSKRSIYSASDMHLKTHRSFSFQDPSHAEKPVRIRGIAFLFKERIAIADYNNNCIHIYQNESRYSKINFDDEPRGMAGIDSNQVVVTFSYEKRICVIYIDINGKDLRKSIPNVLGKPFSIAYHDKHFVVEFNEGEDGFIGVLDMDGNIKFKTENIACFFTGNTIRLALDMKANRIFVSALGKQEVSCIHFDQQKCDWKIKASSPRSIIFIPANSVSDEPMIMLSSKMSNTLYQLNPNSGRKNNARSIQKPGYITYQPDGELIAVESEDTIIVFKLAKRHRSD